MTLHTVKYAFYTIHTVKYTICTLHTVKYTLCTLDTVWYAIFTLHTVHYALCTLRTFHCTNTLHTSHYSSCPLHSCPLHICPLHSCPLNSCPLHSCPLHSCPLNSCTLLSCPPTQLCPPCSQARVTSNVSPRPPPSTSVSPILFFLASKLSYSAKVDHFTTPHTTHCTENVGVTEMFGCHTELFCPVVYKAFILCFLKNIQKNLQLE